jgi:hypothetical protein
LYQNVVNLLQNILSVEPIDVASTSFGLGRQGAGGNGDTN